MTSPVATTPPSPAAFADAPGQSTWEIVSKQYRRNRLAVWAGRIVVVLLLTAILAPLLANNLPYLFRGAMPGPYREQFDTLSFALQELDALPAEKERTAKQIADEKRPWIALQPFLSRETAVAAHRVFAENKGTFVSSAYQTGRFTMADARTALPPESPGAVDTVTKEAGGRVEAVFDERARRQREAIELGGRQLVAQVGGETQAKGRTALDSLLTLLNAPAPAAGSPEAEARRKGIADQTTALQETLNPATVTLVPRTVYPLFRQLTPMDLFLLVFAAMYLLVGPVVFRAAGFARRYPMTGPRFRRKLAVILLPPIVAAGLMMLKQERLANLDYKTCLKTEALIAEQCVFPPVPYGINESDLEARFAAPSADHLLGTDGNGRDLMTRMLWGGRISLSVGFVSTGISLFIGLIIGMLAGYYRGAVDMVVMRVIEIVICFPSMFLLITIMAFVPPNVFNIMVVIGFTSWTGVARLIRGEFFRLRNQEFVLAAKALGVPDSRIIVRHILPNGIAPVLVAASFGIASAILVESSLSFLGFGITIPIPSWGGIISDARQNLHYWWLVWVPGLAIFLAVTTYNLVGDALRDAIDPRLKV